MGDAHKNDVKYVAFNFRLLAFVSCISYICFATPYATF